MRIPLIPILFLALPFIEIAGFILVGRQIGVLATLALLVAAGVTGAILLRIQGFGIMERIRREMDAGRDPSRELANGAMVALAGILLIIPGFFTDILGLLLFLPPVRAVAWQFVRRRVVVASQGFGGFTGGSGSRERTIDLDADEYRRRPSDGPSPHSGEDSPWRRLDNE